VSSAEHFVDYAVKKKHEATKVEVFPPQWFHIPRYPKAFSTILNTSQAMELI